MQQLFSIPVVLTLAVTGLAARAAIADDKLLIVALVIAAAFAAVLFVPRRQGSLGRVATTTLADAALVTAILLAAQVALTGTVLDWPSGLRLAVTACLFLACTLAALQLALAAHADARALVVMLLALMLATPLWLGPVVEAAGNPAWQTNLAVAISPLSLFAVALDVDLLRTSWFYEHSAIGSLRYAYPSLPAYLLVLMILGSVFLVAATRRPRQPEVPTQ